MLAAEILANPVASYANEGPAVRSPAVCGSRDKSGVVQQVGDLRLGSGRHLIDVPPQGPPGRQGKVRRDETEEMPGSGVLYNAQGHHSIDEPPEIENKY